MCSVSLPNDDVCWSAVCDRGSSLVCFFTVPVDLLRAVKTGISYMLVCSKIPVPAVSKSSDVLWSTCVNIYGGTTSIDDSVKRIAFFFARAAVESDATCQICAGC